jgi:hypothetical protein
MLGIGIKKYQSCEEFFGFGIKYGLTS